MPDVIDGAGYCTASEGRKREGGGTEISRCGERMRGELERGMHMMKCLFSLYKIIKE